MKSTEIHYKNSFAAIKIGNFLSECLNGNNNAIVCIGSDKCIADSLGPIVGTMLSKCNIDIDIYGTLNNPVHALNLEDYLRKINKKNYDNVLSIDACLSNRIELGIVEVKQGPLSPGKGLGKQLQSIGDYSILGIVSTDKSFIDLVKETRLSLVYEMAEVICAGVIIAINSNVNNRVYQQVI